jgi:hypothetical protein
MGIHLLRPAAPTRCFNHPDRPALAICVDCRRPVCQACSTLWEGIHCCVDCLAKRRATAGERGGTLRLAVMTFATLTLLCGATILRAWIGAVLAEVF